MDMSDIPDGAPWLEGPIRLHSLRNYKCSLKSEALCKYQQGFWRFWYQTDHRYGVPTTIFFCVAIGLFALAYFFTQLAPRSLKKSSAYRRPVAVLRYLSYRSYYVRPLGWNSPPLGVMMLGGVGAIYFFSMMLGPKPYYWPHLKTGSFGNSPPIATRSGWLAMGCLPFIFAMGAKANLVTLITGVSHEKLQVFHRWISYAMFVTALVHTFPFIVYHIKKGDMHYQWLTSSFYWTGVVAIVAQAWLTFASFAWFRTKCYEFFKAMHFLAAIVFFVFLFIHCGFELTSWDYCIAAACIYAVSFFYSQLRTYLQHGFGHTATSTLTANGFVRVAVPAKSSWSIGQHIFVRFIGLGPHAWTSHPFTVCSLPARAGDKENEVVLFIRPQGGFTSHLARHVKERGATNMQVLIDGPYGGIDMQKFASRDRLVVIAGGSGSGWTLPLVEAFLRRCEVAHNRDKEAARLPSMKVIIATRDLETRCWYKDALAELVSAYPSVGCELEIEIYRTSADARQPSPRTLSPSGSAIEVKNIEVEAPPRVHVGKASSNMSSDSEKVQMGGLTINDFDSRPNLAAIVASEATSDRASSLGFYLCGPHGMQNDVSNAVAAAQVSLAKDGSREAYFHMEHFAWA